MTEIITEYEIAQLSESELTALYNRIFKGRACKQQTEPEYQQMTVALQAIKRALYRFKMRACFNFKM